MVIAIMAAALLSVAFAVPQAFAQERGNAQAEQSQALRNRGGSDHRAPPVGRYVSESGEAFTLDRSGQRPLLRFDRRDETWVLRPTAAPRGDIIYRNDAGQQILRVTPGGGMTVFTSRAPGGSPVSLTGPGETLAQPSLGRLIEINVDTDAEAEGLTVEALILSTDAVLRIARSPTGRSSLNQLRRILIVQGGSSSVSYVRGELRIVVAPTQGVAGRPSSARVIRAFLPQDQTPSR
jgi:hypothetical protein